MAGPQGVVAIPAASAAQVAPVATAGVAAPPDVRYVPVVVSTEPPPSPETLRRARVASDGGYVAGRVLLGSLLSYTFTIAFGVVTVLPFAFVCRDATCLALGLNGAVGLSTLFGMPLGMLASGAAFNGMGGYGWSMLGTFVGMLVSTPLSIFLVPRDAGGQIALSAAYALLPFTGAALAYELSSAGAARRTRGAAGERAFRPVIAPMALDRGAGIMVGGVF